MHILGQYHTLSLCHTLNSLDRDLILLEQPSDNLSESQEKQLFQFLRSEIITTDSHSVTTQSASTPYPKPGGKIVIFTSTRFATAVHADRVIVMSDGRIVQDGTYKELIVRTGLFRDQILSST